LIVGERVVRPSVAGTTRSGSSGGYDDLEPARRRTGSWNRLSPRWFSRLRTLTRELRKEKKERRRARRLQVSTAPIALPYVTRRRNWAVTPPATPRPPAAECRLESPGAASPATVPDQGGRCVHTGFPVPNVNDSWWIAGGGTPAWRSARRAWCVSPGGPQDIDVVPAEVPRHEPIERHPKLSGAARRPDRAGRQVVHAGTAVTGIHSISSRNTTSRRCGPVDERASPGPPGSARQRPTTGNGECDPTGEQQHVLRCRRPGRRDSRERSFASTPAYRAALRERPACGPGGLHGRSASVRTRRRGQRVRLPPTHARARNRHREELPLFGAQFLQCRPVSQPRRCQTIRAGNLGTPRSGGGTPELPDGPPEPDRNAATAMYIAAHNAGLDGW